MTRTRRLAEFATVFAISALSALAIDSAGPRPSVRFSDAAGGKSD